VPAIKAATGALVLAEGPHRAARPLNVGEAPRSTPATTPISARSRAGRRRGRYRRGLDHRGVTTPGHTANHMAFALKEANLLFSGDHVMAWSTPIVAPPDGAMSDYMASLQKLAQRSEAIYLPGHGGAVREAPSFVRHYIRHARAARPRSCTGWPRARPTSPPSLRAIYIGLDPRLVKAAGLSVLAHLEDLGDARARRDRRRVLDRGPLSAALIAITPNRDHFDS